MLPAPARFGVRSAECGAPSEADRRHPFSDSPRPSEGGVRHALRPCLPRSSPRFPPSPIPRRSSLVSRLPSLVFRFTLCLALFPALISAADLQVAARLSADKAGTDDAVALTVTVQGDTPDGAPQLPPLDGFRLLGGPSISQQVSIVNMSMSKSVTYTWELQPLRTGTLTIDSVTVQGGGKTYKTRPLTLEVIQGSVQQGRPGRGRSPFDGFFEDPFQPQARQSAPGEVRLRVVPDKRTAYAGEQITLTTELLTQVQVRGLSQDKAPGYDGFWVETVELPPQPEGRWVEVDGKRFMAYPIRKDLLFANAPGTKTLAPVEFRLQVVAAEGPFGFGSVRELTRASAPVELTIKEWPAAGKPEGFAGAVGQFTVDAVTDKVEVREGDALAYRLTIRGTGNLKTLPPPAFPVLPDCKIYDPKEEQKIASKSGTLSGSRTWEWVVIPGSRQLLKIPAITFAWFDPAKGTYASARTPERSIFVKPGEPGGTAAPMVVAGGEEVKAVGRDLAWISTDERPLEMEHAPLEGRAWFLILLALPFLGNLGLWLALRQRRARAADPARTRARRAAAAASARIDEARRAEGVEFHRLVRSALAGFAGDRAGRAGEGLSLEELDAMLASKGADGPLRGRVRAFMEERDRALYAPGGAAAGHEAVLDEARGILKALERIL